MALPAWEELQGSPKDGISTDSGPYAERLFLLLWVAKGAFYQEMWDNLRHYPEFMDCWLLGIDTEPFSAELCPDAAALVDPTSDLASYALSNAGKTLLARVKYGFDWGDADWPTDIPKPDFDDGTELGLRVRGAGEIMLLPARDVRYYDNSGGDPGKPLPQHDAKGAKFFVATPEYQCEWRYVDDPPTDDLNALLGHTNDAEFLGVPAGCLRFDAWEQDAGFTLDPDDPFNWIVRVDLKARRILDDDTITWNHDYRGDPPGWEEVILSDGTSRFPQTDFSDIFKQ